MSQIKSKIENKNITWSARMRFRVGDVCEHNGVSWVNTTGKNSEPGIGQDWLKKSSIVEILNVLTSTREDAAISANQARILKENIDAINAILASDDITLDELQEVVNYIKANREDLANLSIDNIAGLSAALAAKMNKREWKEVGGTTYSVVAEDVTKFLAFVNSAGCTVTVPDGMIPMADHIIGYTHGNITFVRSGLLIPEGSTNKVKKQGNFKLFYSIPDGYGLTGDLVDTALAGPRPEKRITNATQYTAIKEDATKYLVFDHPIDFIINDGVFAKDDELEGDCEGGDINVVKGAGVTLLYLETQRPIVLNKGPFGMRFKAANKASLFGALKPL